MTLMYPHIVDRYRILQWLIRMERQRTGVEQREVIKGARIVQATLSQVENMVVEQRTDPPKEFRITKVRRRTIYDVLNGGLKLPPERVNAGLWLFDGETLTEDEIAWLRQKSCSPQAASENPRSRVIAWLDELLDATNARDQHDAKVRTIYYSDPVQSLIAGDDFLLKTEQYPGQRLLVFEYPSFLTQPPEFFEANNAPAMAPWLYHADDEKRKGWMRIATERRATFEKHLTEYGERIIHRKSSVRDYAIKEALDRKLVRGLDLRERRRHIENLIHLLNDKNNHFAVGLAKTTPRLEMELKSTYKAIVRGMSRYDFDYDDQGTTQSETDARQLWGPQYIEFSDTLSSMCFLVDFEKHWDAIPEEDRNKESVIAQLKSWLTESPR